MAVTKTKTVVTESKTKKTKQTKEVEKKEKPKSNIPVIKRPRKMDQDSFADYINSTRQNFEFRLGELDQLHELGKCPHKASQHLRAFLKELEYLNKRISPLIKHRRKQGDKKNNVLMKKITVSPALAKFLHLGKNEQVSRSECNTAITMYINVKDVAAVPAEKQKWLKRMNPDGKRCLQSDDDGSVIVPDKALSALLDYPAYQKRVAAGKQVWHRRDKETKEMRDVVETNDRLTYSVIQHLLAPHFRSDSEPTRRAAASPAEAPVRGRKAKPAPEPEVESEVEESEVEEDDE